jgi:hypothetical protein
MSSAKFLTTLLADLRGFIFVLLCELPSLGVVRKVASLEKRPSSTALVRKRHMAAFRAMKGRMIATRLVLDRKPRY